MDILGEIPGALSDKISGGITVGIYIGISKKILNEPLDKICVAITGSREILKESLKKFIKNQPGEIIVSISERIPGEILGRLSI